MNPIKMLLDLYVECGRNFLGVLRIILGLETKDFVKSQNYVIQFKGTTVSQLAIKYCL